MNRPLGKHWIVALSMAVALTACSGNAGGSSAVPTQPGTNPPPAGHHHLKVTMHLKIPARHRHFKHRKHTRGHPRFISSVTAGIIVKVYAASDTSHVLATVGADISSGSTNCVVNSDTSRDCTFYVPAPPGSDVFTATTWDQAPTGSTPHGAQLAIGTSVPVSIVAGQANSAGFTVDGVVASTAVVVPNPIIHGVVSNSQDIGVVALDADGTPIVADTYSDASGNAVSITLSQNLVGALGSSPGGQNVSYFGNGSMNLGTSSVSSPQAGGVNLSYDGGARITQSCNPGSSCSGAFVNTITATPSNGVTAGTGTVTLLGPTVTQFTVSNGPITGITLGPDGNLWFAPSGAAQIGRITPAGVVSEFPGPSGAAGSIATGSDGNLWFTEPSASNVGAMNTSGVLVTEAQATTSPGANPAGIASGPDGNIWYSMNASNVIGTISIPGHIVSSSINTGSNSPTGMASVQGQLWWGNTNVTGIGSATPTFIGMATTHTTAANGAISSVAGGPDNNVWFTEPSSGRIGVLTVPGLAFATYSLPCCASPQAIVAGPDGNVWFADSGNGTIGYSNVTGTNIQELPNLNESPQSITVGPEGNIWFGENSDIGVYSW